MLRPCHTHDPYESAVALPIRSPREKAFEGRLLNSELHSAELHSAKLHSSLANSLLPTAETTGRDSISCNWICSSEGDFLPQGFLAGLNEFVLSEVEGACYLPISFLIAGVFFAHQSLQKKEALKRNLTVWIGRELWPTPYALPSELREHAIFLNPRSEREKLWMIDAAIRSKAVLAVIAHQEKMAFTLSQRFAYTARTSGVRALFLRPLSAKTIPSAAPFRWQVMPQPPPEGEPLDKQIELIWSTTLLKAKQGLPQHSSWLVSCRHRSYENEAISLRLSSGLVNNGRSAALLSKSRASVFPCSHNEEPQSAHYG